MSVSGKRRLPIHKHLSTEILEAESIMPLRARYKGVHSSDVVVDSSLLLNETVVQWTRFYEAELPPVNIKSGTTIVDDVDASGKKAIRRTLGQASGLMFDMDNLIFSAGDCYVLFRMKVASNIPTSVVLQLQAYRSEMETATKSNLTSDAPSGQKIVNVVNGGLFSVGNIVKVKDDSNSEISKIASILVNELTMEERLSNTYTILANAETILLGVVEAFWNIKPDDFPNSGEYHHFAFRMNVLTNIRDIQFRGSFTTGITDIYVDWIGVAPANIPIAAADVTVVTTDPSSVANSYNPGSVANSYNPGSTNSTNPAGGSSDSTDPGSTGDVKNPGSQGDNVDPGSTGDSVDPGSAGDLVNPGTSGDNVDPGTTTILTGNHQHTGTLSTYYTSTVEGHSHSYKRPAGTTKYTTNLSGEHQHGVQNDAHVTPISDDQHTTPISGDAHATPISGDAHTTPISGDQHGHTISGDIHSHSISGDEHTHSITGDAHPHSISGDAHPHSISGDSHTHVATEAGHEH